MRAPGLGPCAATASAGIVAASSSTGTPSMSVLSSLAEAFAAKTHVVSAWCGSPDPMNAAVLAREGFDAITFDMQHGPVDFAGVLRGIPLVHAAGKPAVARIPVGDFTTVSRLFDAGCSAVIAPMVNSVEDAQAFVHFAKFPPLGARSWGPYGALPASGLETNAYLRAANGFSLAIAMIETRAALAALDGILAVPGIDGVFVGPSDLSIALSDGAHVNAAHPDVDAALVHVVARAHAAGKVAACYAQSAERAAVFRRMGFDFVALMGDLPMLRLGAQAALAVARG